MIARLSLLACVLFSNATVVSAATYEVGAGQALRDAIGGAVGVVAGR